MDWEIYYVINQAEVIHNEEKDEFILTCQVPEAKKHLKMLLDGATQVGMDYVGNRLDGQSVIGFRLYNANGEMYLALPKKSWELLLEQPDSIFFIFGEGDKDVLQTTFFNRRFDDYVDTVIEQYNEGNTDPFTLDIVEAFADES